MLPLSIFDPGKEIILYLRDRAIRGLLTSAENGRLLLRDVYSVRVADGRPAFEGEAEISLAEAVACGKSFDRSELAKEKLCWDANLLPETEPAAAGNSEIP